MKQLKSFTLMLLSIVLLAGITACSSSPEEKLKSEIEAANKNYPQEMSPGFEMTKIMQDGNKTVFLLTIDSQKSGVPISLLENQKETMKTKMSETFTSNSKIKPLLELLVEANNSFVCRMQDEKGKSFDIEYSTDELKQLLAK